MIPTLQDIRKSNLQKGTQIRKNGYKSSIHALPPEVKLKLDELLTQRISPINVLRLLCNDFPNVDLPSAKAVENYRNKYHTHALVKQRALRVGEMRNDMTKQELEREILNNCHYLIIKIMPKLQKRLELALEIEAKSGGLPLRITNETLLTFTHVLKIVQEIVTKNELWMITQANYQNQKSESPKIIQDNENEKTQEEINQMWTKILTQKDIYNSL